MTRRFPAASWPTSLKVISTVAPLLLVVVMLIAGRTIPADPVGVLLKPAITILPFVIIGWSLLFVIRGYEVDRMELRIERLLWSTKFPMEGISRVWSDPEAMKGSLRVVGNGGVFSFSGIFQNKALGRYRSFATDPEAAVVLVFRDRTIVVTPDDPVAFVEAVCRLYPSVAGDTSHS